MTSKLVVSSPPMASDAASIIDAIERGDAQAASELCVLHVEATAVELALASLS